MENGKLNKTVVDAEMKNLYTVTEKQIAKQMFDDVDEQLTDMTDACSRGLLVAKNVQQAARIVHQLRRAADADIENDYMNY